jgi:hypothetical protein
MPSGKDRLYLTLHIRDEAKFHCGFLLSPKAEGNRTTSYAFDITNDMQTLSSDPIKDAHATYTSSDVWWHRMPRPVRPVESRGLFARILITKLPKGMIRSLENEFRSVEITPGMTCYTWSLAAIHHLRSLDLASVPTPDITFQEQVAKFAQAAASALFSDPPYLIIEVLSNPLVEVHVN